MLLLIIGLHCILGAIWLINNNLPGLAFLCFGVGMTATHFGWKKFTTREKDNRASQDTNDLPDKR